MSKVIKASGNDVEPYWPMLFAKALKTSNIDSLLTNVASAGGGGGASAAVGGPSPDVVVEAEPEKEVKEE